jgi:hypothetical protein
MDWFREIFSPQQEDPTPPFDVMEIALPGEYNAKIEQAELYRSKQYPEFTGVKLKIRLVPDDPEDKQRVYHIINRREYVELLQQLGIKRTNNIGVLVGCAIYVKVKDHPFMIDTGQIGSRVQLLEHKVEVTPKPRQKRRSTRAPTPRKKS